MSRVIATNETKEEFDDVLETPLANFPFDFDESSESAHELQAAQVHSISATASNNSSSQLPGENDDQNYAAKSNTSSDDSMTEDEDEDVPTKNDRDDAKIKVIHLNCSQADCGDKLDTLDQLHEHLLNKHGLAPLQCFCGCKSRFDNARQMSLHLQDSSSKFSCPSCSKVFSSQRKTYQHWSYNHVTGQFQCNIDHCSKVVDARKHLYGHQRHQHCPESQRLQCPHDGCTSSFVRYRDLKIHEMIHLNTKPFHCKWPKCIYRSNRRPDLCRHIRSKHLKKQLENGIVGESDLKKYVRVVKE